MSVPVKSSTCMMDLDCLFYGDFESDWNPLNSVDYCTRTGDANEIVYESPKPFIDDEIVMIESKSPKMRSDKTEIKKRDVVKMYQPISNIVCTINMSDRNEFTISEQEAIRKIDINVILNKVHSIWNEIPPYLKKIINGVLENTNVIDKICDDEECDDFIQLFKEFLIHVCRKLWNSYEINYKEFFRPWRNRFTEIYDPLE